MLLCSLLLLFPPLAKRDEIIKAQEEYRLAVAGFDTRFFPKHSLPFSIFLMNA